MSQWIRESYGPGPDQFIERITHTDSGNPLVVAIHGGYWKPEHDREHMRPLSKALAESGLDVALVEYRRIPGDPDATIADIKEILSSLSPRRLVLLGFSAGGQLALIAAPDCDRVDAVIALAPVTDLVRSEREELGESAVKNWLGQTAIDRSDLDPTSITSFDIPIRIFHGIDDQRVPIEHSRDYVEKMQELDIDAQLMELPGLGHFELMDPAGEIVEKILELFRS
jgi:acetyl esterase/lipase